ncbi:hypothetical protein Tco_1083480 [Tanacetum coccineum]
MVKEMGGISLDSNAGQKSRESNGNGKFCSTTAEVMQIRNNGYGSSAKTAIVRPMGRDVAYLQTSLLIAKEEEGRNPTTKQKKLYKFIKDENFPIVNQVDARFQNFEIQFLKEVAKFVRDFKSLAKEADESLAKHKFLEHDIERLLRAVVSQDIMSIVQNPTIEQLQAQLGDLKGKSKDTPYVSDTLDSLSQKLEDEKVELEFQVLNYAKESAHLKTTYKNLFDSINMTRTQTKTIIDSLQEKLHNTIYENAKLRAQLVDKVSEQQDTTIGTSMNTKFTKQSILGKPPSSSKSKLYSVTPFLNSKVISKVGETNALLKPVTSNSAPSTRESKVVKNDNVIAPGMFRINPSKTSRVDNVMPNKPVKASVRTKPITTSQPHVISQENVNSNSNGISSTGVESTAKTRRPQPRSNTKNDRVPSASKSSYIKNKDVEVEEHHRNLLLSKNKKHMSSECNNVKLAIQNDKSEVVCAMCKQCLITANHDVCVFNYVNGMNSREDNQSANVSNVANQKKQAKSQEISNVRVVQICLWCIDSGCPKHMTGNLKLLINFIWKFLGTVGFRNDHIVVILGYGDHKWGNILITRVYFIEGLGHNLFSVGQFCDSDLDVAFRRNTCFVKNLEGVDLLKGNHTTNLYTINLHEMASASPICLIAHATSTKSKDEAPEEIKTFLKKITALLQALVIIVRTNNDT